MFLKGFGIFVDAPELQDIAGFATDRIGAPPIMNGVDARSSYTM